MKRHNDSESEATAVVDSVAGPLAGGGQVAALMREFDWASTALGPIANWPESLKTTVGIVLASPFPMLIWWGPQLHHLYNDAYRPVLGDKHPASIGKPGSEVWSEIWHILGPRAESVLAGGPATFEEDMHLPMNRYGFIEETYFTFSYSPIPESTAPQCVGGVLVTCHETTAQIVGGRRVRALRDLGARSLETQSAEEACAIAASTLGGYGGDIPFALVYLLDGSSARLAGITGIAGASSAAPSTVDLGGDGASDGVWPLAEVARTGRARTVDDVQRRIGSAGEGLWAEPPTSAMILPIPSTVQDRPAAILVAAVSPRLGFDEGYQSFLELVASQIGNALTNARAYEEERRRAEALAELDRAKTAFFSNISHEFRTPLTLLLGPAEDALRDSANPPETRQRVAVIHRNALRLHRLVNDLLEFSRIEAGRVEAAYEATDLAAYTAELASSFRSATDRAGLELVVDTPPLGEPVYVDRGMWEKIVLNLVSNAFKHTFEGRIAVSVRAVDGHIDLIVNDTGVGIPAHQIPRLFERFHRVPNARSRTHEGTGIGLALVQELVRLHGGRIAVTSEEDVGTAVTVRLPLGTNHLPRERLGAMRTPQSTTVGASAHVEEALRWFGRGSASRSVESERLVETVLSAAPPTSPPSIHGSQVLLADDNADLRDYVARLLSAEGWSVQVTANGDEALRAARASPPSLVLADIMMPVMDGFALLRALRADPATSAIAVILLSARAGEESRIEALEAGADDYVVKPFSARELTARVAAALERKKAEVALRYQHAQIETLVNRAPLGVYLVDADFRIREVNPIALPVFGDAGGPGGVVGCDFDEIIHRLWEKDYADEIVRIFRHTLETGESYVTPERAELRIDRGTTEYYEWRLDRITLPDGRYGVVCYFRDISQQVQAREAIAASEARYRTLYESIDEGFCVIEVLFDDSDRPVDYRFLETNPAFVAQTGLSDVVGRTIRDMVPGHESHWFETYGRIASTGTAERFVNEAKMLHRWYDVYAFRVGRPEERKVAVLFRDITARKRAEEMLRASEQRYRTLVENVRDYAILPIDENGLITDWTPGAVRVMEYAPDEVIGRHFSMFYTPEDATAGEPRRELDEAAQTGRAEREGWRVRKGGRRFWVNEITSAVRDDDGRLLGFTTIARDLTERRMAEASAERARAESEREALRLRLSQAEEEERRRLARELHDEAGQHLTALSLGLQALSDVTPAGSDANRRSAHLRSLASTLGQELHALALRLRPKVLDEFGLEPALFAYAEEWSRQSGIAIDIHARLGDDRLPPAVESAVYRIVQEALTNVAKHSRAGRASIHVERRDGVVVAIVEDDGQGFDPAVVDQASHAARQPPTLGLLGIRERAALLGGTVEIESAPGEGTTLFVQIPVTIPRSNPDAPGDASRTSA